MLKGEIEATTHIKPFVQHSSATKPLLWPPKQTNNLSELDATGFFSQNKFSN